MRLQPQLGFGVADRHYQFLNCLEFLLRRSVGNSVAEMIEFINSSGLGAIGTPDACAAQIDRLALSHGQARWVLDYLGLHAGEDVQTFDAYIKSLRRDGVPFARDELGVGPGHNLKYRYSHLMELAVALA